jgi:GTP:adenosylcobinamide-phosphate guanylyltransferase
LAANWHAVILAASRGASDPMAQAYGVLHKCRITIGGVPMIARVVGALQQSGVIDDIAISTESENVYADVIGERGGNVHHVQSQQSAPSSALHAIRKDDHYPVLITTGDHALLTADMVRHVCDHASRLDADFTVGLATAETILQKYPGTRRTFFTFAKTRVSGCNLFTVHTEAGLRVLERWQTMERNRKKPWKLVFSFGVTPLLRFAAGQLTLDRAFEIVSQRMRTKVSPLLLPFPEAAIDVDKPADKELAELIVSTRAG